jgi:hypothetical protein
VDDPSVILDLSPCPKLTNELYSLADSDRGLNPLETHRLESRATGTDPENGATAGGFV